LLKKLKTHELGQASGWKKKREKEALVWRDLKSLAKKTQAKKKWNLGWLTEHAIHSGVVGRNSALGGEPVSERADAANNVERTEKIVSRRIGNMNGLKLRKRGGGERKPGQFRRKNTNTKYERQTEGGLDADASCS